MMQGSLENVKHFQTAFLTKYMLICIMTRNQLSAITASALSRLNKQRNRLSNQAVFSYPVESVAKQP